MRTEWFIGLAAVILIVIAGVVAIDLNADDDPDAAPSPTASPTATSDPTTEPPSEDPTQDPSPSPSPTPSESEEPSPEPSETDTDDPEPEPTSPNTSTPVDIGDDASPVSRAAISFTNAGSRFSSATSDLREADHDELLGNGCPVIAGNNETFTQCRGAYSTSVGRYWAVTEVADGPGHRATLWRHNGAAGFTRISMTGTYNEPMTLGGPSWPNHDDVMTLDFGSSVEVLTWEAGGSPRVAARIPLDGGSFDLIAQQVFVATSGANRTTTVLDIGSGSASGQRTNLSAASDRSPEEVALLAYRAWTTGNRAAAAPYVNDAVDEALFDDAPNQGGDLFSLAGTSCPLEDGTFTCTFTSSKGTMNWSIRSLEGELRVVAINSSG